MKSRNKTTSRQKELQNMEPTEEILTQFYLWLSFQSIEDFYCLEPIDKKSATKPISAFFSPEINSQGQE
jgi:hypothetical protein